MKRPVLLLLLAIVFVSALYPAAAAPAPLYKFTTSPTPTLIKDPGVKFTISPTPEKCGSDYPEGRLIIESEPAGANISYLYHRNNVGSQMYKPNLTTPFDGNMFTTCEGDYFTFYLKKAGYEDYSETITLKKEQLYTIHAVLVPLATTTTQPQGSSQPAATSVGTYPQSGTGSPVIASGTVSSSSSPAATTTAADRQSQAPGTGSLSVTTNPAGAAVEIDGIPQGASPATIPGISAGTHNLTITKPGYTALITQVNIVAGQANEYSTTLIPSTQPTAKQSPGFALIPAALAVAGTVLLRKIQ